MDIKEIKDFLTKDNLKSLYSDDTKPYFVTAAILGVFILTVFISLILNGYIEAKSAKVNRTFKNFSSLAGEYDVEEAAIKGIRTKLNQKSSEGTSIQSIASRLGIKSKLVSFKLGVSDEKDDYNESSMNLVFKGLTNNEFVNLMYRIEEDRSFMFVERLNAKVTFDDLINFDFTLKTVTKNAK